MHAVMHDQIAAAERHAAEQAAEAERLRGELVVVTRELDRVRRRQFCLQAPVACTVDRIRGLARLRRLTPARVLGRLRG